MKNTLFRKLREPDSGAGGGTHAAPAAPAAPASHAAPSAPAGDASGAGSGAPAAETGASPASVPWPDQNADFAAWDERWSAASDEEREAYLRDNPDGQHPDDSEEADPNDSLEDPKTEDPTPSIAEDAEITEEILKSVPANVRKALQDAQSLGERYEALQPLIAAEDGIRALLSDPIGAKRAAELQHGISIPKWLESEFNADAIVEHYLANSGKELDASLDRDGAKASLTDLVKNIVTDVSRRVELQGEFKARQIAEQARRERVLSEGFSALAQEFAALKSDKPIDSAEHPIEAFRSELLTALENGDVSFEYATRNMKAMFAGHSVGSVGEAVQSAAAKVRTTFIGNLTKTARQSAVTATGAARNAAPPPANAHGVDEGRFLSDPAYQATINARADELADGGDYALLDFLGQVYDRGRTRR